MKDGKKRKLPEGWRWERLGDIAKLKNGINFSSSDVGSGILTLDVYNMFTENIYPVLEKLYRVNIDITDEYLLKKNDILFVRSSVKKEGVGWSTVFMGYTEPVCFCGFLIRARLTKSNILPQYIVQYFRMGSVRESFISASGQSTITNINQENLRNIPILLPPTLSDQTRIATELERKMNEVEKMREAALRRKEAISAMQGAILREVFLWKEGDRLPEGWRWENIRNNMENSLQIFDKASYSEDEFYYIDIASIDNISKRISGVKQIPVSESPSRAKYIVKENDIIVSTVRPNLNAIALIDKNYDGHVCSNGFCVVRLKKDQHPPYYFHFLMSPRFVDTVSKEVQGTMYPAINDDYVKDFELPLPPTLSDQTRIATELERKMAEIQKMRQAADSELEAISSLPGAILREVFDFEEENIKT